MAVVMFSVIISKKRIHSCFGNISKPLSLRLGAMNAFFEICALEQDIIGDVEAV